MGNLGGSKKIETGSKRYRTIPAAPVEAQTPRSDLSTMTGAQTGGGMINKARKLKINRRESDMQSDIGSSFGGET